MIGIIYRIEYNENPDIRYIGSTLQELRYRWRDHKNRYKEYQKNNNRNMSIHTYFDQYGINNFNIIKIKEYEVFDKKQLESYEQLWINKFKCINIQSAFNPLRNNKICRNERLKQYRNIKYICPECNIELSKKYKAEHNRSKKHLKFLES